MNIVEGFNTATVGVNFELPTPVKFLHLDDWRIEVGMADVDSVIITLQDVAAELRQQREELRRRVG